MTVLFQPRQTYFSDFKTRETKLDCGLNCFLYATFTRHKLRTTPDQREAAMCRKAPRLPETTRRRNTGLNSTLFIMGKSETKTCGNCGELENVEHIILKCESYSEEREELCEKVREAGREWNIMGILGAEGKGVGLVRKALLKFLYDSRLSNRI